MSESIARRLQRLEDKIDDISRIVYEMQGELKGWKQQVLFLSSLTALLISALIRIIMG